MKFLQHFLVLFLLVSSAFVLSGHKQDITTTYQTFHPSKPAYYYGQAVAMEDKHLVIAEGKKLNTFEWNGSKYIATGSIDEFIPDEPHDLIWFKLDISGNQMAVSISYDQSVYKQQGIVQATGFVRMYEYIGNKWSFTQEIRHDSPKDYDQFGLSISLDGDYLAIGAKGVDPDTVALTEKNRFGLDNSFGAVYIYKKDILNQLWTRINTLWSPDAFTFSSFGEHVDMNNSLLAISGIKKAAIKQYNSYRRDTVYDVESEEQIYLYKIDGYSTTYQYSVLNQKGDWWSPVFSLNGEHLCVGGEDHQSQITLDFFHQKQNGFKQIFRYDWKKEDYADPTAYVKDNYAVMGNTSINEAKIFKYTGNNWVQLRTFQGIKGTTFGSEFAIANGFIAITGPWSNRSYVALYKL